MLEHASDPVSVRPGCGGPWDWPAGADLLLGLACWRCWRGIDDRILSTARIWKRCLQGATAGANPTSGKYGDGGGNSAALSVLMGSRTSGMRSPSR